MKTISAFLSLVSLTAAAQTGAPAPVVGDFEYAERYVVERNHRIEVVEGSSSEARRRVRELERNGHACAQSGPDRETVCVKNYFSTGSEWIRETVEFYFAGWLLRTDDPIGDMQIVFDSEKKKIWRVTQKAMLPGKATYVADYVWNEGAWSLHLNQDRDGLEGSFFLADSGIRMPLEFERPDGSGVQRVYITADLRRVR